MPETWREGLRERGAQRAVVASYLYETDTAFYRAVLRYRASTIVEGFAGDNHEQELGWGILPR